MSPPSAVQATDIQVRRNNSNYRFPHGNLSISRQADVDAKRRESTENHVFRLTILAGKSLLFNADISKNVLIFNWNWNARKDVVLKCEAFRSQGGTQASAAADTSKLHGCSFDVEMV
jgi:hypothetical protein